MSAIGLALAVGAVAVAILAVVDFQVSEERARRHVAGQAARAAGALADEVATLRNVADDTARTPGLAAGLVSPGPCNLTYKPLPVLGDGHLDIVAADGRIFCSSDPEAVPGGLTHAGAAWLDAVRRSPEVAVSVQDHDPVMAVPALIVAAAVRDGAGATVGFIAAFHPLAPIPAALAAAGADRGRDVTIFTISDRQGAPLASSSGGRPAVQAAAPVELLGWTVSAGMAPAAIRHEAWAAIIRHTGTGVAALVLIVATAMLIRRRIARPLLRLRGQVQRATHDPTAGPVEVHGPAEVAGLAEEVNEMLAARAEHHAELAHRAMHDTLTGLPNRAVLTDRLHHAHQRAERSETRIAVLFVDIDNFKAVNDSLGHEAGDQILVAVAGRLMDAVRVGDTVVRFAGDEFVLICEGLTTPDEAVIVASRIEAAMAEPFIVAGEPVSAGVSIGVAHGTPDAAPDQLLRDADVALYQAKARGRGRHAVYDDGLRQQMATRADRQQALTRALERDELDVVYQPQYDLRTGAVVAVEALVRWAPPDRGDIPRDWFLPIAEDTGLIIPIGDFVLDRACRQAAAWHDAGRRLRVSVNLSLRQLCRPGLTDVVERTLATTGIDPAGLCFEISERTLAPAGAAADALERLAAMGLRISVDDFGSGQLSLPNLQRIPADEVKIDGVFLHALGRTADAATLLRAMTAAAHALGLDAVVEGVERPEQLAEAVAQGCDFAQGRLLCRPTPADELPLLLERPPSLPFPHDLRL
jgi:diguanylate cyclase (GGDEF)-like protein